MNKNPYKVLGLKPEDNLDVVEQKYKKLRKTFHPDKPLTDEMIQKGITPEKKLKIYSEIGLAFNQILDERKHTDRIVDAPDFLPEYNYNHIPDMKYNETHFKDLPKNLFYQENKQQLNNLQSNFSHDMFNRLFEQEQQKMSQDGFLDPNKKGYDMFNFNEEEHNRIRNGGGRESINVETPKTFAEPRVKNGELIKYNYHNNDSQSRTYQELVLHSSNLNTYEIGATNIDDFSVSFSGMVGSDLMSVYGENRPYWEDEFKNDQKMYDEFMRDKNLKKEYNARMTDRSGDLEFDEDLQKQLLLEKEFQKRQDLNNMNNQLRMDAYYNNMKTLGYQ